MSYALNFPYLVNCRKKSKGRLIAMYGKANKPGTLHTTQLICGKEESPPLVSECLTRMMTPEEWEKYGPLITDKSKKIQKSKNF